MKKQIEIREAGAGLWLDSNIVFAQVPGWWGHVTRQLSLSLIRPFEWQSGPRPLLVWLCGGAFISQDRHAHLPNFIEFARAGYSVASVEYRNTGEAQFPAQIEDVKAAIRFLRANAARYGIDPARIGIMGESAGGYLANMAGATNGVAEFDRGEHLDESSDVQAVCSLYGASRLAAAGENPELMPFPRLSSPEELLLGTTWVQNPAAYERADPATWISANTPPFLLIHGTEDTAVPISQSEYLYDALEAKGIHADFYALKGAGHSAPVFYQAETRAIMLEFFDRTLRGIGPEN